MPTIMIIDDEEMIRSMLHKSLTRLGYNVLEAENGREGMDILKKEDTDLVIADLVMPEKGGLEVLMELNTLFPDMKKIAISGKLPTDNESISGMINSFGVDAIFPKPFEIFDLLKEIKALVPLEAD